MAEHRMERSPLNHGDGQWCAKCKATDREIRWALGPVCPVEDQKPLPLSNTEG